MKKKAKKKAFESKRWYDFELSKKKRLLCEKVTLMSKYPNDPYFRGSFYKCNKEYAKLRKYKKKEYTQNILDSLDKLQTKDPKQYWQLVNSLCEGTKNDNFANSINGNTWFDYFSNLSTVSEQYAKRIEEIEIKIQDMIKGMKYTSFSSLDFKISARELQMAFSKLKPNTSAGLDSICNEMLKAAQVYLTPLLLKLLNAVFTAGIYPDKWLEGYTTPIFKSDTPKLPQNYRGVTITNIILNSRLEKFLIDHGIIHECQIGFSNIIRKEKLC